MDTDTVLKDVPTTIPLSGNEGWYRGKKNPSLEDGSFLLNRIEVGYETHRRADSM